jgi:hypothetical protein
MTLRLVLAVEFIPLILLLHPFHARGQEVGSTSGLQNFDGSWWTSTNSDERIGFLYALDDCLTYDVRPALWFDDTWTNYEQKITGYYASSSANRTTSVQHVLERFGKRPTATESAQGGERYGNEFWRAHSDLARRGFLEGYISCRSHYKNAPKWSKPLNYYLEKLNDMYNADDRHGENAPEYAGSVASALDKLRDHQHDASTR